MSYYVPGFASVGYKCNGVCHLNPAKRGIGSWYKNGYKMCSTCNVAFETDALKCPCCHYFLKRRARHRRSKEDVVRY